MLEDAHPLVHVLPLLPRRLQHVELTVPSTVPATDVAHALSHCTALVSMSLTFHSITSPHDFDTLVAPNLATCTLRVIQPCSMPIFLPFVQHCHALTLLDVAVDNSTTCSAPTWLGTLPSLQRLSLRGVNLTAVPQALTQLVNLTNLDLSFNSPPLTPDAFPSTLAGLKVLRRVVLHNALARSLPAVLSTLPALQELDVAYNCDRAEQATAVQAASPADSPRTLHRLHLRLPVALTKTLLDLCLSSNRLPTGQLSELLPRLPALRRLDLSGCGLEHALPASLSALTALEHLDLSGNNLHVLPVSIVLQLPKLRTLHCMGNACMRLMPETLSLACHPVLCLLDLRREEGSTGPTNWDAPSLLVLVHLTWLMLRSPQPRSVWVGCQRGVVVNGVCSEFGGGPMERAVEAHVRRTQPNFCAELDALRASIAARMCEA